MARSDERAAEKRALREKRRERGKKIRDARNKRDVELGILARRHRNERKQLWDRHQKRIDELRGKK